MNYSRLTGTVALAKREILRFCVVWQQTLLPPLVTSLLFLFIFGLSIGKRMNISDWGASYLTFILPGLMTMHLISSAFENTSSSLFIARWHNHIQEILLSPLSYFDMVLGMLIGGMARAIAVTIGVYIIANCFEIIPILHPWMTLYYLMTLSIIFSCAGMAAALWAENFGMLSMWNIYVITPSVFLGGVFNPIHILPEVIQPIARLNPMRFLVSGMRHSITGIQDASPLLSAGIAGGLALFCFLGILHLFRIGYKLRV